MCCGHDLVEILCIGLQRVLGERRPVECKPADIARNLLLAYDSRDFEATNLWAALENWEEAGFRLS